MSIFRGSTVGCQWNTSIFMTTWKWMWSVVLIGLLCQECHTKTHFKYMTNYCSETVEVTTSLVLVLTQSQLLQTERKPDYFHCSVDLMAAKGRRLHVHFLHLSISSDEKHTDRLKLFEAIPGRPRIELTPPQGLYGMINRSLMTSDKTGSSVGEFRSHDRWLQVEYLGKPTQTHSGFRMLVTSTLDQNPQGKCPSSKYRCGGDVDWCIPSILVCDGYPNCGVKAAVTDEKGCHLHGLVSSVSYSLSQDIVLIGLLPVTVFILAVVFVVFTTRWHVNKQYPYQLPPVQYTNVGDGHIAVGSSSRRDEPPSYTEAMGNPFAVKPPSYNALEMLEREGLVTVESDSDTTSGHFNLHRSPHNHRHHHHAGRSGGGGSGRHCHERLGRDILTTSNSSLEQTDECHVKSVPTSHNHRYQRRIPRPTPKVQYDASDDEETKRRDKRKGGKCKSKSKRRADDLCPSTPITSSSSRSSPYVNTTSSSSPSSTTASLPQPKTTASISPHMSPSSSSSFPPSTTTPSPSTTSNYNVTTNVSSISLVSSSPSIPTLIPTYHHYHNTTNKPTNLLPNCGSISNDAVKHSNASTTTPKLNGGTPQSHYPVYSNSSIMSSSSTPSSTPSSTSAPPVLHISTNPQCEHTVKPTNNMYQDTFHSDVSSGPEADRKSETESVVFGLSSNARTESCTSLSESPIHHNGDGCDNKDGDDNKNGGGYKDCKILTDKNVNGNGQMKKKKTPKTGEVTKPKCDIKNSSGVFPVLSPLDTKFVPVGDDEIGGDADVSSDSDGGGVEVDLRRQEVVSLEKKKKYIPV